MFGITQYGTQWDKVAGTVGSCSGKQCYFYYTYHGIVLDGTEVVLPRKKSKKKKYVTKNDANLAQLHKVSKACVAKPPHNCFAQYMQTPLMDAGEYFAQDMLPLPPLPPLLPPPMDVRECLELNPLGEHCARLNAAVVCDNQPCTPPTFCQPLDPTVRAMFGNKRTTEF